MSTVDFLEPEFANRERPVSATEKALLFVTGVSLGALIPLLLSRKSEPASKTPKWNIKTIEREYEFAKRNG
jgi:hypothetical protein